MPTAPRTSASSPSAHCADAGHPGKLSEESEGISTEERTGWNRFWLVDPLDGTKEFIKKTGQFTVNIALIENGESTLGIVLAPASGLEYFASHPTIEGND